MKYSILNKIEDYKVNSFEYGNFSNELTERLAFKKIINKQLHNLTGYEFLFKYFDYSDLDTETHLYPKSDDPLVCIFCLKSEPDVSFNNKPHVIPYFLGNKYLLHYEECDECNAYFSSSLEDALDKYTAVFRTVGRIKNRKRKITAITSLNNKFSYNFNSVIGAFEIQGEGYHKYINDDGIGNLKINFDIKKHRPSDVYKGFMKIFYGLLPPEHRKNFNELRSWIMDPDPSNFLIKPVKIVRTFMPYFKDYPLVVNILHTEESFEKTNNSFDYMGLIAFGNIIYEMPIISDRFLKYVDELKHKNQLLNFDLKLQPKPIHSFESNIIDLSNTEKITDSFSVIFSYSERIKK
ncbi:HNH endonuclease [Acinetobacter baumannii]|uniref:HNH endonuclease n=1 Tax=Acinetobacter sp. AOR34_HL TaxID=2919384 RepID=UPI0022EAB5CC|nr:HNH endonuclease [Acinetobacter sp. AOR34_HL]MDA3501874.1 HNH endonuclease [Acinetobacter sp. AOR34_HL]